MSTPDELLEEMEEGLLAADHGFDLAAGEWTGGRDIDRRHFMFVSLVTAAASTLGAASALRAQETSAGSGRDRRPQSSQQQQQPQQPPLPLGNGEAPALQFQPYPAGTGALMERLASERGRAAFDRATFDVPKWSGPVPTSPDDLAFLPAHRLAALLRARKVTSLQLTELYLARLERLNPTLNCVVTLMAAQARAEAQRADAEIAAGKWRGPLHGLPYGVKDLFSTRGVPTTWGAADFKDRIIDEDAEIVVRLREAGAILVAKLSTGLFAQNDWWFGGRTNNPWNLSQGSSGSSAGPSSAVAAGCVAFAIGTETQGSIVSPAVRCGLTALRPTFGRVSRHGGMVLAWSQDRVGPMCRTAEDCAMVFNVLHGVDEKDPSTVTTPFHFERGVKLSALRIGVDPNAPKELVAKLRELGMNPREIGARPTVAGMQGGGLGVEYAAAFDAYVQRKAKETGLDLDNLPPLPPPAAPSAPGAAAAPAPNAAPSNPMAPADWNPRFVNGRRTRGFDFLQVQRRRYAMIVKWGEFMRDLDMFIAAPMADVGANAQTGHPCVVFPYKFDVPPAQQFAQRAPADTTPAPKLNAQPICATIVGALYADDRILSVAHQFQQATDFHARRPVL
ncbi:MAG: amidase [Gemmatimonadaceae bacterium]|nr:amidase [Gemmatimonadaceae bacterium]